MLNNTRTQPATQSKVAGGVSRRVTSPAQFNRQNVNQEQPLLLEELLEQEKREQEREGGEWGGVGSGGGAAVPPQPVAAPPVPAIPLYSGVAPPAPPAPSDRPLTDADHHARLVYEQWLKQYNAFATDQLRYYEGEVQKLRKIRKVSSSALSCS